MALFTITFGTEDDWNALDLSQLGTVSRPRVPTGRGLPDHGGIQSTLPVPGAPYATTGGSGLNSGQWETSVTLSTTYVLADLQAFLRTVRGLRATVVAGDTA
jgi:hypothetical protein